MLRSRCGHVRQGVAVPKSQATGLILKILGRVTEHGFNSPGVATSIYTGLSFQEQPLGGQGCPCRMTLDRNPEENRASSQPSTHFVPFDLPRSSVSFPSVGVGTYRSLMPLDRVAENGSQVPQVPPFPLPHHRTSPPHRID